MHAWISHAQIGSHGVLIVDIDLRQESRIEQLRPGFATDRQLPKTVVVHNQTGQMVAQARALGATAVISSRQWKLFSSLRRSKTRKGADDALIGAAAILSVVNVFVHTRDAWTSVVPTGITLSTIVTILAFIISRPAPGPSRNCAK